MDKILDFGCGTGLSIYIAKSFGYNIVGLDVDQRITDSDPIFSEFHKQYGIENDVVFYAGSGDFPFESDIFGSIVCCSSLLQDNTTPSNKVNLIHINLTRLEKRIRELIRISTMNANWFVSPSKDWVAVKRIFQQYNNKGLTRSEIKDTHG